MTLPEIGPGSRPRSCRYCGWAMRVEMKRLTMEGEEVSGRFTCGAANGSPLPIGNSDGSPSMFIWPEHEAECFVEVKP